MRTFCAALLILVGGLLIVMWAVSGVAVQAVERGTAVSGIAERALDDPAVVDELGVVAADAAIGALEQRGVLDDQRTLEPAVRLAVEEAVATDAFRSLVLSQVGSVEQQFADALTASLHTPAPFVVEADLSSWFNSVIDGIPVVGAAVPELVLPPIEVDAIDADTFSTVHGAYAILEWLAVWGVWVGVALIVVGMFVTRRFRWFLSKVGLAIAAFAVAGLLALRWWGIDALASAIPGAGGAASTLVEEVITDATVPLIQDRLWSVAIWGAVAALVFFLIGVLTLKRTERR